MQQISHLLEDLMAEWTTPRHASHRGQILPVPLTCSFQPPSSASDIENATSEFLIPKDLISLWKVASEVRLFEDAQYGQWGLHLFSPSAALDATKKFASDRPEDYALGDMVVGEFLGDSDLLILRCDPSLNSYGSVVIALPLDDRMDWGHAADSLSLFFEKYIKGQGEKFWHSSRQ
jgi:hypothetical protein